MSATYSVPDFLPSRHGFQFDNCFPCGPVVTMRLPLLGTVPLGNASNGLCGGMIFAVRDCFEAKLPIPPQVEPPCPGQPLFNYLVRRLWDSFRLPGGPMRYYRWMGLSDRVIFERTLHESWPRLRAELDRGKLVPLGLIRPHSRNPLRLGENHQVLAHGYTLDRDSSDLTVHLYDPNWAKDDEVRLTVQPHRGVITASTGETVRGFFPTYYRPPGFAWCSYLMGLHCPANVLCRGR